MFQLEAQDLVRAYVVLRDKLHYLVLKGLPSYVTPEIFSAERTRNSCIKLAALVGWLVSSLSLERSVHRMDYIDVIIYAVFFYYSLESLV
ncbi:hypothetical protein [Pantoea sp. Nvir]|uniref:hypothetical protein n=1 Tax=Pantoea sp. Nvir TaxID=2576760 RepID=UPI0027FC9CBF|nr:hypothetical protein [Pantoea sp. Nvir]CAJ0990808.1 hypothetical protein NVIRPANT_00073 [Pantoea sp. Nvir]